MTDHATIASSLTKAQKAALCGAITGWRPASYAQVKVGLRRKGLINSVSGFSITPLGLAVRAILQEEQK